jgi:hypothetical protein
MPIFYEVLIILFILNLVCLGVFIKHAQCQIKKTTLFLQGVQKPTPHCNVVNNNIDYII